MNQSKMSSPSTNYQEQEIDEAIYTPIEVQEQKLKEILEKIKSYGYYMQKSLNEDNFKIAIKYCEEMLSELRISILLPKLYNQLCNLFSFNHHNRHVRF
jgi:hypothetical protein